MRTVAVLLLFALAAVVAAQEEELLPVPGADSTEFPVLEAEQPAAAPVADAPATTPLSDETVIYRSVGADGSIIFSDTPSAGAVKVDLQETQTIEPPPPPRFEYQAPTGPPAAPYARLEIVNPENDAQIRENSGALNIDVALEPGLSGSDRVVILIDGQEAAAGTGTSFSLGNVDRGTHRIEAIIRGADGSTRMRSPASTFHMLRYHLPPPKPAKPPAKK